MIHVFDDDNNHQSSSKSTRADFYVPYPVQNSIPYFGEKLQNKCMKELNDAIKNYLSLNKAKELNFGEFSKQIFGETLQNTFIRPYNEKVWTISLEEMSSQWVEGRVPCIDYDLLKQRCTPPKSRSKLAKEDSEMQQIYFR